jgi:LytS/YehU family sensor histidine kinase
MTSYTLSMIILYTFDYNVSQWQYVRRLASVADQQTEMLEQGIKLDFILDSLENIEELAIEDPLRSGLEAKGLREYIIHTFEAMRAVKLVAFSRELSVIKQMVKLENLKQPDDRQIQAEYNIEISSFKVPSLSIRMLAENAISSLLASSQESRKLVISTREHGEYYEIEIKDNGLLEPEGDEAIGISYLAAKDLATRQLLEIVDAEVKELPSFRQGKILHILLPKKSG